MSNEGPSIKTGQSPLLTPPKMAKAGKMAMIAKNTDPGNVIRDKTPSMNSRRLLTRFNSRV